MSTAPAADACERGGTLKVTINKAAMPKGTKRATIRIYSPQTNESQTITVAVGAASGPAKMGVPGIVKN